MQDWKDRILLNTELLDDETKQPPLPDEATHRVIGNFPRCGDKATINGLVFKVTYRDHARGTIYLKLLQP